MKYFLWITLALQIALLADCMPLPAGQIVKYSVPSKFFNRSNVTSEQNSDPLYNLLTQIHYGGTSQTVTINSNSVQAEDITMGNVSLLPEGETTTNESPEVIFVNSSVYRVTNYELVCFHKASNDVTEQHQQMDVIKVNVQTNKNSFDSLIEKVVNDELEKLANEKSPIGASELIKLSSESFLNILESTEQASVETTTLLEIVSEQDQTELSATTRSVITDSETILPTNAPAVETETIKLETISDDTTETLQNRIKVPGEVQTTANSLQLDETVTDENSISDSLLSAVGDLLSSILGLDSSKEEKSDENATVDGSMAEQQTVIADNKSSDKIAFLKETIAPALALEPLTTTISFESEASSELSGIEQGTKRNDETATPVGYEGEQNNEEESGETTETVTLKISTLVSNDSRDKDINEIDLKIENLANAQTSFATENTPEQVTETVRLEATEGELEVLEVLSVEPSADGVKPVSFEDSVNQVMNLVKNTEGRLSLGDSVLIDKNMKEDMTDLDQIVYGTLKELESNLGMRQQELTSFNKEPAVKQGEILIKNFETQTKNTLINKHPYEFDNFMVNSAKAAMQYKRQDESDF